MKCIVVAAGLRYATQPAMRRTMKRLSFVFALALLGCAGSPATESPATPADPDTPVASPPSAEPAEPVGGPTCPDDAFMADGACYETSDGACLALGCADCQILETSPAEVRCAE